MVAFDTIRDEDLVTWTGREAGAAFGELFRRYERPMLAFFVQRTRNPDLAADLTAETFARAVEARSRYAPERGAAASWLFGIAQNVLGHSMRRRRVDDAARRRLAFDHDRLDAETRTAIEALHAEDAVNSMLQALPLDQRDAVRARILDGTPYDELAVDLACSPMVARKRVSRGLATLRAQLKGTP